MLSVGSEGVQAYGAVAADDSVARYEQWDGVLPEGRTDGTNRSRVVDLLGDPVLRADAAGRNRGAGLEHRCLELREAPVVDGEPDGLATVEAGDDGIFEIEGERCGIYESSAAVKRQRT